MSGYRELGNGFLEAMYLETMEREFQYLKIPYEFVFTLRESAKSADKQKRYCYERDADKAMDRLERLLGRGL